MHFQPLDNTDWLIQYLLKSLYRFSSSTVVHVFFFVSLLYWSCILNVCQDSVSPSYVSKQCCCAYTTITSITSQLYPLHDMTYFNAPHVFTTGNRCKHFSLHTVLHIALGLLQAHILL